MAEWLAEYPNCTLDSYRTSSRGACLFTFGLRAYAGCVASRILGIARLFKACSIYAKKGEYVFVRGARMNRGERVYQVFLDAEIKASKYLGC